MSTAAVAGSLAVALVALAATWAVVARVVPALEPGEARGDGDGGGVPSWVGTTLALVALFVGPLVAAVAALYAASEVGAFPEFGIVPTLLWFHVVMVVLLLEATWFGARRAIPVLEGTDGVDVSPRVVAALRTASVAGGLLAAFGFLVLILDVLRTFGGAIPDLARASPRGALLIVAFGVGGPLFTVGYGALIALYLRITVIKPDES
jgi:hypothetical protein